MVEPAPRVLGGRYELDSLIASGGMGQVWRGRDRRLGRSVAVKVLRSEYTGDPAFLSRFRGEATHAAGLSHPNIAAVYDYGEVDTDGTGEHHAYLVMELVEGESLSTLLRDGGPLSPEATLSLLRQAAQALAEAHHVGLVHRDVKPGNIIVRPDGTVKITDFGIAWSAGSSPLTEAGQVLGTPQYLSPEQAVGRPPSPASDVYSLGLVGYECLAGHPAFAGQNAVTVALKQVHEEPEPLPDDLPPGVRELLGAAVAKDPRDRIPDADAFVAAIDAVRAGRPLADPASGTQAIPPVAARRVPGPRSPSRVGAPGARSSPAPPARRARLRTVAPAVLALLVGVGLAVLLFRPTGGADTPVAGATQTQQDAPIVLHDDDYVGRPVDDVALELAGLGLTVERQGQDTPGVPPGDVTQLTPVGRDLQAGDPVTIFFAAGLPAAPSVGNDAGGTPGTSAAGQPGGAVSRPARTPAPGTGSGTASGGGSGSVTSSAAAGTSTPTGTDGSTAPGSASGAPSSVPGSSASESSAPESSAPEPSAPESSAPESSAPESSAPESSAPESSAPESSAPESSATGSPSSPPSSEAPPSADAPGPPPPSWSPSWGRPPGRGA